jgi:hypothetical protein
VKIYKSHVPGEKSSSKSSATFEIFQKLPKTAEVQKRQKIAYIIWSHWKTGKSLLKPEKIQIFQFTKLGSFFTANAYILLACFFLFL